MRPVPLMSAQKGRGVDMSTSVDNEVMIDSPQSNDRNTSIHNNLSPKALNARQRADALIDEMSGYRNRNLSYYMDLTSCENYYLHHIYETFRDGGKPTVVGEKCG